MPRHHVIDNPSLITNWLARQRIMAARGDDWNGRHKTLYLDATGAETYWVVEATNDKGQAYDAFTASMPYLNKAIEFYNDL